MTVPLLNLKVRSTTVCDWVQTSAVFSDGLSVGTVVPTCICIV